MCGQIIKWLMSSISFQHALAFIKRVLDVPAERINKCRQGMFSLSGSVDGVFQCLSMSLQTGGTPKSSKYLSIEIHGDLGIHGDPCKNLRISPNICPTSRGCYQTKETQTPDKAFEVGCVKCLEVDWSGRSALTVGAFGEAGKWTKKIKSDIVTSIFQTKSDRLSTLFSTALFVR